MTTSRHPFLIFLCAILALFQITNALAVLQLPGVVASAVSIPGVLQVVLSAGWALLFLIAAVSLVTRKHAGPRLAGGLFLAFVMYSLLRLVIFARADYDRERLPSLLIVTVLLLALPVGLLFRASARHALPANEGTVHDSSSH